jgi:uncharacterized protein (DUF1778 family)
MAKQKLDATITARFTKEELAELKQTAEALDQWPTEFVRDSVRRRIKTVRRTHPAFQTSEASEATA